MGFFGGGGASASNMVGATSSVAGTAGLVPAPAAGDNEKYLFGDATFKGYLHAQAATPFVKSSSRFYYPYLTIGRPESTDSGNLNNASGAILCPFLINGSATVSGISFITHTANANLTVIVGIYQSDISTGWPLTKKDQATSINLSSTATGVVVTTSVSASVSGLFWGFLYVNSSSSFAAKAGSVANDSNNFVQQIAGTNAISSVPRRRFGIKNSSISSGVLPSTLTSSDLQATDDTTPMPTLAVTF